jgi:hypothetical protein
MTGFNSLPAAKEAVGPEVFAYRYRGNDTCGDGTGGSYAEGLCPVLLHRHFMVIWKRHTGSDGKIAGVVWHPVFITDTGRMIHGYGRKPADGAPAFTRTTGGLSAVAKALGTVVGAREVPAGFELLAPGVVIEFPFSEGSRNPAAAPTMKAAAWACATYPSGTENELF